MTTHHLALQDGVQADIDRQVESGRFATAGDYVSELVREDQLRMKALEQRLLASLANTEGAITLSADEVKRGNVIEQVREKLALRR